GDRHGVLSFPTRRSSDLSGILPGVTRAVVFEVCSGLGIEAGEVNLRLKQLRCAEGVFLSLSTAGIAECISLDGLPLAHSPLLDKDRKSTRLNSSHLGISY